MNSALDILIERLKTYDEVMLCELLNITSEDILERFRDIVAKRATYLKRELEVFNIDDEELEDISEVDGFEPEGPSLDYDDEEE